MPIETHAHKRAHTYAQPYMHATTHTHTHAHTRVTISHSRTGWPGWDSTRVLSSCALLEDLREVVPEQQCYDWRRSFVDDGGGDDNVTTPTGVPVPVCR